METQTIRVYFTQGYAGGVKASVVIGNEHNGKTLGEIEKLKRKKGYKKPETYILETEYLCELLEKQIEEKGYTIEQSARQKYPRLKINE